MRATNWVGDAVMSLPAIRALRGAFPKARITVAARPWVADLYAREEAIDSVIPYPKPSRLRDRFAFAAKLKEEHFDAAVLLQNAFDAALLAWLARIPVRIGYDRDARGFLLTHPIPTPDEGAIPRHERFYYLELLRRAGVIQNLPACDAIRLGGLDAAREAGGRLFAGMGMAGAVLGVSPGAAYGDAKRWMPEGFAEAARLICAGRPGSFAGVAVFGSVGERPICERVAELLRQTDIVARNLAGETTLREFIDMAAACSLFLTNDSGAMHIASAADVPTVTVFGSTDDVGTGPTGAKARIVSARVDCAPCLLRECPIDHRCMTRVRPEDVAETALKLLEECAPAWIPDGRS